MTTSPLLKKDDYWAIWIGGFLLLSGLLLIHFSLPNNYSVKQTELRKVLEEQESIAPFKTIQWYLANDNLQSIKGVSRPLGSILKKISGKPASWQSNPLRGLGLIGSNDSQLEANYQSYTDTVKTARLVAQEQMAQAEQRQYSNEQDNKLAIEAIAAWRASLENLSSLKKKASSNSSNLVFWLIALFILLAAIFGLGAYFMDTLFLNFTKGFVFVFVLGLIAYLLAAQVDMKAIGFGYAAWAIILGLLISNTVGTPDWVTPALRTEYYIKTGLVILGAEILLSKILAIGLPGIFVAWIVTPVVLVSTFWFGQRILKISSKTLNMTISADMSVCGVSAAVATAAACKATKEELTVAIGLSMIFTSVMMIILPAFINYMGISEVLGGAWIGGTLDATGAVVAAGAFLGEKALSVAATIKMIQNVLIGVIAFGVAIYFSTKVDNDGDSKIGWGEIWKRFPKFILGFIGASIVFSLIYIAIGDDAAYALIDQGVIAAFTKNIRGWLFCLAFVSIGLSINFKSLAKHFVGGKPLILYLCGQTLNLCLTLLMAYIVFYLVFPDITANI